MVSKMEGGVPLGLVATFNLSVSDDDDDGLLLLLSMIIVRMMIDAGTFFLFAI